MFLPSPISLFRFLFHSLALVPLDPCSYSYSSCSSFREFPLSTGCSFLPAIIKLSFKLSPAGSCKITHPDQVPIVGILFCCSSSFTVVSRLDTITSFLHGVCSRVFGVVRLCVFTSSLFVVIGRFVVAFAVFQSPKWIESPITMILRENKTLKYCPFFLCIKLTHSM